MEQRSAGGDPRPYPQQRHAAGRGMEQRGKMRLPAFLLAGCHPAQDVGVVDRDPTVALVGDDGSGTVRPFADRDRAFARGRPGS